MFAIYYLCTSPCHLNMDIKVWSCVTILVKIYRAAASSLCTIWFYAHPVCLPGQQQLTYCGFLRLSFSKNAWSHQQTSNGGGLKRPQHWDLITSHCSNARAAATQEEFNAALFQLFHRCFSLPYGTTSHGERRGGKAPLLVGLMLAH